ncbi:ABC transporter substrate-binding protein [Amycolatopsis sp. GM8]|uniref:ABC transporter substrate-binding protein n=1 Tax=Amycolatopsis sp. GM8 TaxID=2896530 RepID=UPI001F4433B1|nr:ABC transporter substrate-binding protein [Amycolatopsis sp. GM8]
MNQPLARRSVLAGMAAVAAASVVSACGSRSGATTEGVSLKVGNLVGACMSPLFLAHATGLFAKQGINVELTYFGNAGDNLSSLVTDTTGVVHNPFSNTMVAKEKGEDLVIVAGSGSYGLEIIARKGIGVETLSDLAAKKGTGLRVATARVNTQELTLFHVLKSQGLSYQDFDMRFFTDNLALGQALVSKDIDVATVVQPYAAQVVREAGATYLGSNEQAWGEHAPDCVVTMKRERVEQDGPFVERYLTALTQGEDAYKADPVKSAEILDKGKYFKVTGQALSEGLQRTPPLVRLDSAAVTAMEKGVGDMRDLQYIKNTSASDVLQLALLKKVG